MTHSTTQLRPLQRIIRHWSGENRNASVIEIFQRRWLWMARLPECLYLQRCEFRCWYKLVSVILSGLWPSQLLFRITIINERLYTFSIGVSEVILNNFSFWNWANADASPLLGSLGVMQNYFLVDVFQGSVSQVQLTFVGTIAFIFINGMGPPMQILKSVFGARMVIGGGCLLMCLGLILAGFSTQVKSSSSWATFGNAVHRRRALIPAFHQQ